MTRPDVVERPELGWWLSVLGGMAVLAVLAFHDGAYAWWTARVTASLSQIVLRGIFVAALLTHVLEGLYALRVALRLGLRTAPGWFAQTFALGYPSLRLLLRRAQRH